MITVSHKVCISSGNSQSYVYYITTVRLCACMLNENSMSYFMCVKC